MKRLVVKCIVAAALFVVPCAAAATLSISITATGVTAPTVTLNGVDQPQTFTVTAVEGYTGGNNTAGWNVTASATALTSGSQTMPAMSVTGGSFTCNTSCTVNPTNSVGYPVTVNTTAGKVFNAAANTGKGTFNIVLTFSVPYPANAIPGTYTSTVTLSTSTGP
jgi:hypothetical protein